MPYLRSAATSLLLLTFLLFAGCGDNTAKTVDRIEVAGADQCALPGEEFSQPLKIELLGPLVPGMLGGKGERAPVAGCAVAFQAAEGSDLTVEPATAVTDGGGGAVVRVRAGRGVGDQYLKIVPADGKEKSALVRFITGMKIEGANQQVGTGGTAPDPLRVTLRKADGSPAKGIPVDFRMLSTAEGVKSSARISSPTVRTDGDGVAETVVSVGDKNGVYNVGIDVVAPDQGFVVKTRAVEFYGFSLVAVVIGVLGGLALFVFGMELMSDGIQKVAGENMKKVLQFFARNGVVAVLAGTFVTAIIQSSSATTVMVIGFINAGLLNLSQSIGIIFGANIGTTVTAQIISFNLSGLALPAIAVGFALTLSKRQMVKGWGLGVLGFGLLFFGMGLMSDELKLLGDLESFRNVFQSFNCAPVGGNGYMPVGAVFGAMTIGLLATMLIQSSSAAMGIVLALAGSGLIDFYTAVPLLVGTNIGTTVTAQLAALTSNRVAKQAALAHTLFNVFGAAVMLALFYVPYKNTPCFLYFVNEMTPGNVFAGQNMERHIAMAHTMFNVTVVVLLLPFIGQFARFCAWLLPIPPDSKVEIQLLNRHLLATPSVALKQTVSAIRAMVADSWQMIDEAVNAHFIGGDEDKKKLETLAAAEEKIDAMQAEVTAYLVQITRRELSEPQSELVPLLMHCTNDAERIADHAEIILQLSGRLLKTRRKISLTGKKDLRKMWTVLDNQARNVIAALGSTNPEQVKLALQDVRKLRKMAAKLEADHSERLRKGKCQLANAVIFIEMLGEMTKIGDRLSNIAERTPTIQKHYIEL